MSNFNIETVIENVSMKTSYKKEYLYDILKKKGFIDNPSLSLLFNHLCLEQDTIFIDIADECINNNLKLPKPKCISTTSNFFSKIIHNVWELYILLKNNPEIVNKCDENGETLLHHGARLGLIFGSNTISIIYRVLFSPSHLDFNIQNKSGRTPLHEIACKLHDRVSCRYVFPNYVEISYKNNFDFSLKDNKGYAVIHYAAYSSYYDTPISYLIKMVPHIDLNLKSNDGKVPLYIALQCASVTKIEMLIINGCQTSFPNEKYDPMKLINDLISECEDESAPIIHIKKLIK